LLDEAVELGKPERVPHTREGVRLSVAGAATKFSTKTKCTLGMGTEEQEMMKKADPERCHTTTPQRSTD